MWLRTTEIIFILPAESWRLFAHRRRIGFAQSHSKKQRGWQRERPNVTNCQRRSSLRTKVNIFSSALHSHILSYCCAICASMMWTFLWNTAYLLPYSAAKQWHERTWLLIVHKRILKKRSYPFLRNNTLGSHETGDLTETGFYWWRK